MLRNIILYTDYQKLEEGLLTPNIKPFDYIKWIQDIFKIYEFEANRKQLKLNLYLD